MNNRVRRRSSAPARAAAANRPAKELLFDFVIRPPDGDRDENGDIILVDLSVNLREFTLDERQLVKRIMAKFAEPHAMEDVAIAHAWVVWRRTHPTSSLDNWMTDITFGDVLDGLTFAPGHVHWQTTPEGYDPEA